MEKTFILTNDDGINAEGIKALKQAIKGNKFIVAPTQQLSGCGHQFTTKKPITVTKNNDQEYAVEGSPVDCTRIALSYLCPHGNYVVSGINAGGNLGVDIYNSGTVAAVREATILGFSAIAISHVMKSPLKIDWNFATHLTEKVLDLLLSKELPKGCFWNVNLPPINSDFPEPKIIFCPPSIDPLPLSFKIENNQYTYQGKYNQRISSPNTDVDVCFSGNIAISLISLNCGIDINNI
jgi:5'-nucleotidase